MYASYFLFPFRYWLRDLAQSNGKPPHHSNVPKILSSQMTAAHTARLFSYRNQRTAERMNRATPHKTIQTVKQLSYSPAQLFFLSRGYSSHRACRQIYFRKLNETQKWAFSIYPTRLSICWVPFSNRPYPKSAKFGF